MMENIIKELKLELGNKKITLTVKQAKKLKDALDELFGEKVVREIIRDPYPHYPWYWQYRYEPITITPPPTYPIWYSTTADGVSCSYSSDSGTATLKVA